MPGLIGNLVRLWRERKAVTFAPGFWEALRPPAKSCATVNATSALECATALPELLLQSYANLGDAVFEPFAGSGTTILAGQRTRAARRRCR